MCYAQYQFPIIVTTILVVVFLGCAFHKYLKQERHMTEQEHILQFFDYHHLPDRLQKVSQPFHELAHMLVGTLPPNPERTVALRKLLEAKDSAVRTLVAKINDPESPDQPKLL